VDHKLSTIVELEDEYLKEISCAIRSEQQGACPLVIVFDIKHKCMSHRVKDVFVGNAVNTRRRMDVHMAPIVLRNTVVSNAEHRAPGRATVTSEGGSVTWGRGAC